MSKMISATPPAGRPSETTVYRNESPIAFSVHNHKARMRAAEIIRRRLAPLPGDPAVTEVENAKGHSLSVELPGEGVFRIHASAPVPVTLAAVVAHRDELRKALELADAAVAQCETEERVKRIPIGARVTASGHGFGQCEGTLVSCGYDHNAQFVAVVQLPGGRHNATTVREIEPGTAPAVSSNQEDTPT